MVTMEAIYSKTEYLEFLKSYLQADEEMRKKLQLIKRAKDFCTYLTRNHINYKVCIKHQEVLGCDESNKYYQRFSDYLDEDYIVCKNLLVKERKGGKRKFLVIIDSKNQLSFQQLREILHCQKLEFASSEEMEEILNTTPGNVSLFNMINDKHQQVQLVLEQGLLQASLLAFHPLYNGMSIFLNPQECLKFLDLINRDYFPISFSKKQEKQYIKSK